LVEQLTFNQWVAGSNPARLTTDTSERNLLPPCHPGFGYDQRVRWCGFSEVRVGDAPDQGFL
jgi:hypothetical protein